MPTGEERRLKLVKAEPATGPAVEPATVDRRRPEGRSSSVRVRQSARRTVTRRLPGAKDPVRTILERLDAEPDNPAGPPSPPTDETSTADPTATSTSTSAPDVDSDSALKSDSALRSASHDGAASADGAASEAGAMTGEQEQEDGAVAEPEPAPGKRWTWAPTAVLAGALCLTLALAGIFGYRWYQDRALEQARGHALAAARQTTVNFVSVSASSVDGDLQRITAGATGEFKEEFIRGQAQVRAAVIENKVESRGTVLRAGLVNGNRHNAVALVAVDATVKNVHAPEGRPAHYRIRVDLTRDRDSGAWLVSRLQFVG